MASNLPTGRVSQSYRQLLRRIVQSFEIIDVLYEINYLVIVVRAYCYLV